MSLNSEIKKLAAYAVKKHPEHSVADIGDCYIRQVWEISDRFDYYRDQAYARFYREVERQRRENG